ncbi:MAG: pyridoxal-phosphate dependent enzyme, partial [bacterium]
MPICESILEDIGRTPLIRLKRIGAQLHAALLVKNEAMNPGGSIKDRIALKMIDMAEKEGRIRSGSFIIEATAGNTGLGLAQVAAAKGYKCIFVVPDKMSEEKISTLKAFGAEVIITRTDVPPDSPENYNVYAKRLAEEIPDS